MSDTDLPSDLVESVLPASRVKGFSSQRAAPQGPARMRRPPVNGKLQQGIQPVELVDELQFLFYSSSLEVGTNPLSIAASNPARRFLLIQNTGTVEILLGFGVNPVSSTNFAETQAIRLPPGTQIDFPARVVPNNDIFAICSSSGSLSILEGISSMQ